MLAPVSRSVANWSYFYLGAALVTVVLAYGMVRAKLPHAAGTLQLGVVAREGIYFSIGVASRSVYADIDKAMLTQLSAPSAAGIYTAAYRVLSMGFAPISGFLYAANVRMFQYGQKGIRGPWEFARRRFPALCVYSIVLSLLMVACSPLLPLLLGPGYEEAASALRWLAFLPIVQVIHLVLGDVLMGANRQRIRSVWQLYAAVFNALINLAVIPRWSWRGAAIASYATEGQLAFLMAGTVWWSLRRGRLKPRHRLPRSAGGYRRTGG